MKDNLAIAAFVVKLFAAAVLFIYADFRTGRGDYIMAVLDTFAGMMAITWAVVGVIVHILNHKTVVVDIHRKK